MPLGRHVAPSDGWEKSRREDSGSELSASGLVAGGAIFSGWSGGGKGDARAVGTGLGKGRDFRDQVSGIRVPGLNCGEHGYGRQRMEQPPQYDQL